MIVKTYLRHFFASVRYYKHLVASPTLRISSYDVLCLFKVQHTLENLSNVNGLTKQRDDIGFAYLQLAFAWGSTRVKDGYRGNYSN